VALESDIKSSIGDKSLIVILNGLIHVCHGGQAGYMQAAEGITSSAYKTMFVEYAHQRSRFASQIANLVTKYGGDPDDDGHTMSLFPKGWKNIQQVIMGGDYGAIFTECEKSEDVTRDTYEKVIEKELPDDVSRVVGQQYTQIVEAHDRIRSLRDAYHSEHKN